MKKGFSLIEILVVTTIICILTAGITTIYSTVTKNARDAKRKADLEQIRAAVEMFRSNNVNNSYPASLSLSCASPGSINDGTNMYLSKIPTDPKCSAFTYYYSASPVGCSHLSGTPCSDYTLASQLENNSSCSSPPGGSNCGSGNPCNYCLGPYGQK